MKPFKYKYNSNALQMVLTGRFTRMGQLIRTSVLQKAKGADERVFIQDESIPLRSAIHALGAIKMDADVVLVPKELGNFSGNKIQLDNDRFLAYCYTILDNPQLPIWARRNKIMPQVPDLPFLKKMRDEFLALDNVRRIKPAA